MLDLNNINSSWTLFLDRDGVFNYEKEEDYILNTGEFRLYENVLDHIDVLARRFGTIVMVTNQKGIGKGLMTVADLDSIHQVLLSAVQAKGGRIDRIYFAPDTDNSAINRKPQPGMAWQAKADFPHIDFTKSIMVGNKPSDMRFGRNAGMYTVFVATTHPETPFPHPDIDLRFNDLDSFAQALKQLE
ncbi:D-glycero-alpha-D-manno-heptose-1,7-bisphosphate 7-phosphatase [Deminuibacter soli]|uniref:D,D-heptose 1,7-bisphosphate phosphatase n=1 Tax=Deminuibacter soli TaxID=2291815 RepID=A0A3E1NCD3_9BACT|nr:HAD-IIIA family hydrolase [Deminuibacter soli]RFM25613.1 HAD-IIIA family hydrolase [Deminuibacter soli]